jgi:hypothetical protein
MHAPPAVATFSTAMSEPFFELPDLSDPNDADEEAETRILAPDPDLLSYARANVTRLPPTVRTRPMRFIPA